MNFPTLIFEHFVGVETYTVHVHVPLANVPFQIYSMLCREKQCRVEIGHFKVVLWLHVLSFKMMARFSVERPFFSYRV